jgi:outer membrane protein assembly factor BamB
MRQTDKNDGRRPLDINKGETITIAPLIAADKVFVGNSAGEFAVRGWLVALNASDGSVAWRAYSTGPDADVWIGSASSRSTHRIAVATSA